MSAGPGDNSRSLLLRETSLVQVNVVFLIRPGRTLWRMTTIDVPTLVTDLPVCFTSIVGTPFVLHPHLQIPQSHFCTIPATYLVKDSTQMTLDYVLRGSGLLRDLCIRASLEYKRSDRLLFTCKVHASKQQWHTYTSLHFKQQSCHWHDRIAIS